MSEFGPGCGDGFIAFSGQAGHFDAGVAGVGLQVVAQVSENRCRVFAPGRMGDGPGRWALAVLVEKEVECSGEVCVVGGAQGVERTAWGAELIGECGLIQSAAAQIP